MPRKTAPMSNGVKITTMAIGGALLVATLVAAFVRETMSPPQVSIVHTVSSLGGGLVAVGIAGYLTVTGTIAGLAVRAGGPLAVTVLLFVVDPSSIAAEAGTSKEKQEAKEEYERQKAEIIRRPAVTLTVDGAEKTMSGPEAVQFITAEAGLKPGQVSRSASTAELQRMRESLRRANSGERISVRPRIRIPPP